MRPICSRCSHAPEEIPPALAAMGLPIEIFKRFPRAVVYFLCRGPEVRYVGSTTSLGSRVESHRMNRRIGLFDRVYFIAVPPALRQDVEYVLIDLLRPAANREAGRPIAEPRRARGLAFLSDRGLHVTLLSEPHEWEPAPPFVPIVEIRRREEAEKAKRRKAKLNAQRCARLRAEKAAAGGAR